jgi:hypothetical protein
MPSAAAERQRRRRQRLRDGLRIAPVEFDDDIAGALLERGLLAESVADDPDAVGRALANVVRHALTVTRDSADPALVVNSQHEQRISIRTLLRDLSLAHAGDLDDRAAAVLAEVTSYRDGRWGEDRFSADNPYSAADRRGICWQILKRSQVLTVKLVKEAIDNV